MSVSRGDGLLLKQLEQYSKAVPTFSFKSIGKLTKTVGMTYEARGLSNLGLGSRCNILCSNRLLVEAEVIGFTEDRVYLMPLHPLSQVMPNALVFSASENEKIKVDDSILGRVLGGDARPLDQKSPIKGSKILKLNKPPVNPMLRQPVKKPLGVGIRVINALLTVGQGQRVGLFAGSGVGKSVLLGMMSKYTEADITVVGLIGERGREVKEFIEHNLGKEGLKRSVVVASPADDTPLLRTQAAILATAIAEYFRDQGKNVLLLIDSLTRFAQAQRELAIASGEPPATKGYTPSVFYKMTQLVERAGNSEVSKGSITAFYTVLMEGDDFQDPVVDAARAILDGHIVLSRRLAEQGIYPAIDIEASISRVMSECVDNLWQDNAIVLKKIYAKYRENEDMISIGAYQPGSDSELDRSIKLLPDIVDFISQKTIENITLEDSRVQLNSLVRKSAQYPQKNGN